MRYVNKAYSATEYDSCASNACEHPTAGFMHNTQRGRGSAHCPVRPDDQSLRSEAPCVRTTHSHGKCSGGGGGGGSGGDSGGGSSSADLPHKEEHAVAGESVSGFVGALAKGETGPGFCAVCTTRSSAADAGGLDWRRSGTPPPPPRFRWVTARIVRMLLELRLDILVPSQ
jgi:hypothetical protein